MTRVEIAVTGTHGYLIAVETSDQAPGSGYNWDATGAALIVGNARVTGDGCKAWLWPQAGTWPELGRHVPAIDAELVSDLKAKLARRLAKDGKWWA